MSFIASIQARNAEITATIAALVAERDENDAALRVLARFGFDTNSAASTQELPRPMEGAADRGEVRPGLAASNIAPVAMGEADAVDLTASADQSTAARMDAQAEQSHRLGAEGCDDASLFVPLDAPDSGYQAPPVDTNSPETADAGEVGPETVGASPAQSSTDKTVGPSGSAAPSIVSRLRALHAEHPEYTTRQAAEALDLDVEKVRTNSYVNKIKWARGPNPALRAAGERAAEAIEEPMEADPPAEAPEPTPEPESPAASTPEPAIDAQDNRVATAGKRFWLVNDAGLFLNRFGTGFTADRRNAWDGNEKQLAGIRRTYLIARDLREKPVTKEQPAPINREVA